MTTQHIAASGEAARADEAAIEATVADYYLGWYDADPERMARSERRSELRGLTVHRDIASVNVFAVQYVDLLHLVRTTDGWRIVNALWCRP